MTTMMPSMTHKIDECLSISHHRMPRALRSRATQSFDNWLAGHRCLRVSDRRRMVCTRLVVEAWEQTTAT